MELSKAIQTHRQYLASFAKKTSQASYEHLYRALLERFANRDVKSITSQEIFDLLNDLTQNRAQATKRLRFMQTKALMNHCIYNMDLTMKNPCTSKMLAQTFRAPKHIERQLPDREQLHEIIFKTDKIRDRLIIELGMNCLRIGEVLKLKGKNVIGTKLILETPKSGKEFETAFLPEKVAARLQQYIKDKNIKDDERIFNLSYSGARSMMNNTNKKFGTKIRLHDLRRYGATFASRSGVPLEIVSKAFLRHANLQTSQLYLGRINPKETERWVNILYEK